MELRQLEYLVAVAETASFTRAAEREHVSQPGISAQIRQLERQLGAELFDRSGRAATLTVAGRAAFDHALTALAAVEALRTAVDDVNGLVRGRLDVGMLNGSAVEELLDGLAAFRHAHPGVAITLVEDMSEPLTRRVLGGQIDVALIATSGAGPTGVESMTVAEDRIVAAVPHDHPLARRKLVTLADLAKYPIVALPPGTAVRALLDDVSSRLGVTLDVVLQASAPEAVARLALRGLGVGIIPESLARHHGDELVPVAIKELRQNAGIALIWKRTTNPALSAFLDTCSAAFRR